MKKMIISSAVAMVAVAGLLVTPTEACFGLKFNWFFGWNPGTQKVSTPPTNNTDNDDKSDKTGTPVATTPVDTSSTPVVNTTPVVQASATTTTPAAHVATPTAVALPKTGISDTAAMLAIVAVVTYAGAFAVMRFAKQ